MIPSPEVRKLELQDYADIVLKRLWIVVLTTLAGAVFAVFSALTISPVYTSQASISIGSMEKSRTNIPWLDLQLWNTDTQYAVLKSRFMAERVIAALGANMSPEQMLGTVTITDPDDDNVTLIIARSSDPMKAAEIANTWVGEFLALDISKRKSLAQEGTVNLEGPLQKVSMGLLEAERALSEFDVSNREVGMLEERISDLNNQINKLLEEKERYSTRYTSKHPRIVYLDGEIEQMRAQIDDANAQLSNLNLQEKTIEYRMLKEKAESQRKIYHDLAAQSQKMEMSQKLLSSNVVIIDEAVPSKQPASRFADIAQMLIGAFFLGIGICFLLEYVDSSLKRPEEVEYYAKVPFLGYVPRIGRSAKNDRERATFSKLAPNSRVAEAFRNVKVALLFAALEDGQKSILVSSTLQREGRTCVASNLAVTFASSGEKVLLIDADMRRGCLKDIFYIDYKLGLSDVLSGKCSPEQAILSSPVPNLSVMGAGALAQNATDLLGGGKLHEVIQEAKGSYDRIVVDCAPAISLSDSPMVASHCDAVIFVITYGKTRLKDIKEALRKMSESGSPVAGAVLNMADLEKESAYSSHYFDDNIVRKNIFSGLLASIKRLLIKRA